MIFQYNPNVYIGSQNEAAVQEAIAHARAQFPLESCGAIVNDTYVAFENAAENPETEFLIDDPAWYDFYSAGCVDCIVHSHNDYNMASVVDQAQQKKLVLPSLIINLRQGSVMDCIVFGEDDPAPLVDRPFFYGAFDCLSLTADYMQDRHGVTLPNPPHEWEFWARGEAVFEEAIAGEPSLPFVEVSASGRLQRDDLLLYAMAGTRCINHIGVVCSDRGEVLHHFYNRLSGIFPVGYNRKHIRKVLRLK